MALLTGLPQRSDDRVGLCHRERASCLPAVLRKAYEGMGAHPAAADDHAVTVVGDPQRAGIAQHVQPLLGRGPQHAGTPRFGAHSAGSTTQMTTLCPPKPNEFEMPTARGPRGISARGTLGT